MVVWEAKTENGIIRQGGGVWKTWLLQFDNCRVCFWMVCQCAQPCQPHRTSAKRHAEIHRPAVGTLRPRWRENRFL